MKLLCIEDNTELVESLRQFLAAGSSITHSSTGKDGLKQVNDHQFDAIILDLGLPDVSGLDVCLTLRRTNLQTPILILSGHKDIDTKVTLFEAGADDYITKPFTVAELRARLFALLKRSSYSLQGNEPYRLQVGDLQLDPMSRHVTRSGKTIQLRRKEFDILEYLMRNQDKVVTRSMIMDDVWESDSTAWDNVVNVHIKRLRDKIDRDHHAKLIKTAYGLGYTINDKV